MAVSASPKNGFACLQSESIHKLIQVWIENLPICSQTTAHGVTSQGGRKLRRHIV